MSVKLMISLYNIFRNECFERSTENLYPTKCRKHLLKITSKYNNLIEYRTMIIFTNTADDDFIKINNIKSETE